MSRKEYRQPHLPIAFEKHMGAEPGIRCIDVKLVTSENAAKRGPVPEINRIGQSAATILELVASDGFQFERTDQLQRGRAGELERRLDASLACFEFCDQTGKRLQ